MQVLIVDDSQDDAILMMLELKRAGCDASFEWVSSAAGVREALQGPTWDVILCDYSMPGFTAWAVLETCRQLRVTCPVIVVSGVIGEYIAAQIIKAGAFDYLRKGDFGRLAAVFRRAAGLPEPVAQPARRVRAPAVLAQPKA